MKLLRYGEIGREKPGILDQSGRIRDLSRIVPDFAGEALGTGEPHSAQGARSRHAAFG